MATATDVLTLHQWFSPAFPVGAFAYSHGLEWAIDSGAVRDVASAQAWIETALRDGAGWNDALLIGAAYRAETPNALAGIDATARALAASRERLFEIDRQGQAFCRTVAPVWQLDLPTLSYPVAVGAAARLCGLPLDLTQQIFLQAFASNLVSVALRLVPLGQTDGQAMIKALNPICITLSEAALASDLDDLSSTAYVTDLAAMKHETQYARVFST